MDEDSGSENEDWDMDENPGCENYDDEDLNEKPDSKNYGENGVL